MLPWSKVRALCWNALDNVPALVGSLLLFAVKTGIRLVIFAVPTSYVAQWCDVPPTWKSMVFMMFCVIWSDCVFDTKGSGRSTGQDDSSAVNNQKKVAAIMTPAEVAAAARKLSREQKPNPN